MKSFIIKIEWKFIESFNKIISSVINKWLHLFLRVTSDQLKLKPES